MKPLAKIRLASLLTVAMTDVTTAHELRPAYLELRQTSADTFDMLWKVPARGELRLGLYVRFPDGCRDLREPVVYGADNALFERRKVQCPGGLAGQSITIDGLESMLTDVLVRLEWASGAAETMRLRSSSSRSAIPATSPTGQSTRQVDMLITSLTSANTKSAAIW